MTDCPCIPGLIHCGQHDGPARYRTTVPKEPKQPLQVYAEYLHEDEVWIIDVPSKWVIGRIHSGPLAAAIEEIALPEEGQPVQLMDMAGGWPVEWDGTEDGAA